MSDNKFNKQNFAARLKASDIEEINNFLDVIGADADGMSDLELFRKILDAALNRSKPKEVSKKEDLEKITQLQTRIAELELVNNQLTTDIETSKEVYDQLLEKSNKQTENFNSLAEKYNQQAEEFENFASKAQTLKKELERSKDENFRLSKEKENLALKPDQLLISGISPKEKFLLEAVLEKMGVDAKKFFFDILFMPPVYNDMYDWRDKHKVRFKTTTLAQIDEQFKQAENNG